MTDQLRTVLDRIADDAGPGTVDPSLWGRARHARRVQRRLRVAAAAAAVVALAGLGLAGTGLVDDEPPAPPVKEQDSDRPAVPSTVFGVPGDGGLDLETDLAVGPASVAIANGTDAFVVTADDGVYHRLRLPGYDAATYDEELRGIALSPDGTQLAYGFQGSESRTGLRVLDLTTGTVWTERLWWPGTDPEGYNLHAWDLQWSPDGRYVGMSAALAWVGNTEHVYLVVEPAARRVAHADVRLSPLLGEAPRPPMVSSTGQIAAVIPKQQGLLRVSDVTGRSTLGRRVQHLWGGRFSPDGRWLVMSGRELGPTVDLIRTSAGSEPVTAVLPGKRYPYDAVVDLLAWTGERQVLALVQPGIGPSTASPDADLALVTLDRAPDDAAAGSSLETDVEVLGRVLVGESRSVVSIATDLVSTDASTRDFDAPPFAPGTPSPDAGSGSAGRDGEAGAQESSGGPTVALTTLLWVVGAVGLVVAGVFVASVARRTRHAPSGAGRG
jgi:hypothetical protein